MPSIDAGAPGKYRSWICDSGGSQLLYQLIADAPRGLGMLLLIHCLGHLLLLPARIEPVHPKDPNKDHDSEYRHTHLLTDARRWRRFRMQIQSRRRFHCVCLIRHGFAPVSAPLDAARAEAFWGDTLTAVSAQHRTVLLGAGVNRPGTPNNPFAQNRYLNVLLARGEESTELYQERIPIPIAMWKPLGDGGVPLTPFARGTIRIHNQNAAVLICYEQILVWPFLSSALEHPTIILTTSNDYWAKYTRIPAIQHSSAECWARLFDLPVLSATNF